MIVGSALKKKKGIPTPSIKPKGWFCQIVKWKKRKMIKECVGYPLLPRFTHPAIFVRTPSRGKVTTENFQFDNSLAVTFCANYIYTP